jgi:hypothetical protein
MPKKRRKMTLNIFMAFFDVKALYSSFMCNDRRQTKQIKRPYDGIKITSYEMHDLMKHNTV